MITCPWCGTHFQTFRPNCSQCGGSLPLPEPVDASMQAARDEFLIIPPTAPREIPDSHVKRLMLVETGGLTGGILTLLGGIFAFVGLLLTVIIITAFVGIPFSIIGLVMLGFGISLLNAAHQKAKGMVEVLRHGEPVLGTITGIVEKTHIQINNRSPWCIHYQFEHQGRVVQGESSTMSFPGFGTRRGSKVYVLVMPDDPNRHSIYPNPFGYFETPGFAV